MYTLFSAPGTCALAVRIALEETGVAYDTVRVDFAANQQRSAEYLAVNPKGRVPALQTDRGILTEVAAILAFLAQSHPDAHLAPTDPFGFARMQAFHGYLASTVHVAHAHARRGYRWADDPAAIAEMKRKTPEVMTACFDLIEGIGAEPMLAGSWVLGDAYSAADAYLYTISGWLARDGVDVARFPRVTAHRTRMETRPAVQRALALDR
jgi:glutathione S-transferase